VRAGLVARAEEWQWLSLWQWEQEDPKLSEFLSDWPLQRPQQWIQWVNESERAGELEDLRCCAQRGKPFGSETWVVRMAKRLGLESTLRPRGRPKRL